MLNQIKKKERPHQVITDLDYANDIVLTLSLFEDAQQPLSSLEITSTKIGLLLNTKKTECLTINENTNHPPIKSSVRMELEKTEGFKDLRSFLLDSRKDFLTCKTHAWAACNQLHHIWQLDISNKIKIAFFKSCVENKLFYGSENEA